MERVGYDGKTENKKNIKRTIHIFVVILIFLTFFSNTINNFMLPSVKVIRTKSGKLVREIDGQGVVQPKETYTFYTNTPLKVLDVLSRTGQWVKKGQTIMSLDTEELERKLKDEKIIFEQRKINLQKLMNENIEQKYMMDIQLASKKLLQGKENVETKQMLYEAGIETKQELKEAKMDLEILQKEYDKLLIQKDHALKEHDLDIQSAELDLELKKNYIKRLEEELNAAKEIVAPVDGFIQEINFSKGEIANESKPLFKMTYSDKGFEIKIYIDRMKASYLEVGNDVNVKITHLDVRKVKGKIREISENLQDEKDKMNLFIDFDVRDLKGGEQGEIHITKETQTYEVLIPNEAVRQSKTDFFVFLIKEKNGPLGNEYYVQKANIFCGGSDSSHTVVTDGLYEWDKIIVSSDKPISEGDRVKLGRQ